MKGIEEEKFVTLKSLIRLHLQDATNDQYKEIEHEWITQRNVRRDIVAAKIKSQLKVGSVVVIDKDTTEYTVTKINRSKFVGKHPNTNVSWNIPIAMIEEIIS